MTPTLNKIGRIRPMATCPRCGQSIETHDGKLPVHYVPVTTGRISEEDDTVELVPCDGADGEHDAN